MSRLITTLLVALFLPIASGQTTWYVDDDAPFDPGPGDPLISDPLENGSEDHPFDAIMKGILPALDGDTVLVLDGTYTGIGNRDITFLGKSITVRSQNGPENCTIDCENRDRGFNVASGETASSIIDGFTITNGFASYSDGGGGAIYCSGSSPTIRNCEISGNTTDGSGGGVACASSSAPIISGCTIAGNTASDQGGGIRCVDSNPKISNCAISGNTAEAGYGAGGGGISTDSGDSGPGPIIVNCTIEQNTATGPDAGGGGVNCHDGTVMIINSRIVDNTADYGAGVFFWVFTADARIANCEITGNVADADGGAVALYNCSGSIVSNCTVADNSASGGAGIYAWDDDAEIANCIVWENSPDQIDDHGATPSVTYCDVQGGWPGTGNIDADPLFLAGHHLTHGSPCIDAANNGAVPPDTPDLDNDGDTTEPLPHDLDGHSRFVDDPDTDDTGSGAPPIVDMGAYEFQACSGDVDGDGDTDLSDLATLLAAYGYCEGDPGYDPAADLDGSGCVDLSDLAMLLASYGCGT